MLAGAKAQARIKNHHGLVFPRRTFDPTGFDQKRRADLNRLEMPFPRFRPVLAPHFGDFDFAGAEVQAAAFDLIQAGGNFFREGCAPKWIFRAECAHDADLGFEIEIATEAGENAPSSSATASSASSVVVTEIRQRVLFVSCCPPRQIAPGREIHQLDLVMCGCRATCVTLVYSMSNAPVLGSGRSSSSASIMRMTPPWQKIAHVLPRCFADVAAQARFDALAEMHRALAIGHARRVRFYPATRKVGCRTFRAPCPSRGRSSRQNLSRAIRAGRPA